MINQCVEERSNENRPVSTQKRISNESTEQGEERRRSRPGIHIFGSRRRRLAQRTSQICD